MNLQENKLNLTLTEYAELRNVSRLTRLIASNDAAPTTAIQDIDRSIKTLQAVSHKIKTLRA